MPTQPKFPITGDAKADRLLENEPLALVIGMLLDQQVPMEWAFLGPSILKDRIGSLDAKTIAHMDEDKLIEIASTKRAIHRYPRSMALRIQKLCALVDEEYGGDVTNVWKNETTAAGALKALKTLPGYGPEKSKIFLAILVKRFGYSFEGFEKACAPFSGDEPRSAAHVSSAEALAKVKAYKKKLKAAAKASKES